MILFRFLDGIFADLRCLFILRFIETGDTVTVLGKRACE